MINVFDVFDDTCNLFIWRYMYLMYSTIHVLNVFDYQFIECIWRYIYWMYFILKNLMYWRYIRKILIKYIQYMYRQIHSINWLSTFSHLSVTYLLHRQNIKSEGFILLFNCLLSNIIHNLIGLTWKQSRYIFVILFDGLRQIHLHAQCICMATWVLLKINADQYRTPFVQMLLFYSWKSCQRKAKIILFSNRHRMWRRWIRQNGARRISRKALIKFSQH